MTEAVAGGRARPGPGPGWAWLQALVAIAMATTVFYLVTGFLWWLMLNVVAGGFGLAAAAAALMRMDAGRVHFLALVAAGLFVPVNLWFAAANFVLGSIGEVVVAIAAIAAAQVAVAVWAYKVHRDAGPA